MIYMYSILYDIIRYDTYINCFIYLYMLSYLIYCLSPPPLRPPGPVNCSPLGAPRGARNSPGLDFYRFWAVLFPTSIFGWIFHRFWKDFGSILASCFINLSMLLTSTFRAWFWIDFLWKTNLSKILIFMKSISCTGKTKVLHI